MNEIEYAIDVIKKLSERLNNNGYIKTANDLAIQALEKQIPKKLETNDEKDYWNCPNCKFDFMGCGLEESPKYCYECGQRLDWE